MLPDPYYAIHCRTHGDLGGTEDYREARERARRHQDRHGELCTVRITEPAIDGQVA